MVRDRSRRLFERQLVVADAVGGVQLEEAEVAVAEEEEKVLHLVDATTMMTTKTTRTIIGHREGQLV